MENLLVLITEKSAGYELIDAGDNEKLERFGDVVLARPDPQALWHKYLPEEEWKKATGRFERKGEEGSWSTKAEAKKWTIDFAGLKFVIKPTAFKHTGLFPEQSKNWEWLSEQIARAKKAGKEDVHVLNLFAYTGGATLTCAKAGAKVTHVDSSKSAITWARENAELSGLADKPIRWMLDDAREFVKKEIKRGVQYDGIIMDPPSFGHGVDKELWKIEEHLLPLIEDCYQLLSAGAAAGKPADPHFFLINGYSAGYSAIAYKNNLRTMQTRFGGELEAGELAIDVDRSAKLLPAGIFARWSAADK